MGIPVKIVEQPVELRAPGDSRTVRKTNPCGYNPLSTANGETPGHVRDGRLRTSPGSNASQPGSQRWPPG